MRWRGSRGPSGGATAGHITEQVHQNGALFDHSGSQIGSDAYTAEPKKSFFLQFPNDDHHNGSLNKKEWIVYGHVYPIVGGRRVIQYWQLYAYNDSRGPSNHEGDWEFSGVIVDKNETPLRIFFYRHGHVKDFDSSKVQWEGTHHVSYSAKGGHAQYYAADEDMGAQGTVAGDKCDQGTAWDTWLPSFGGVVNIGERDAPLNGANWLRFSGRWGEIGDASSVGVKFTSGPQGPAYQEHWFWSGN